MRKRFCLERYQNEVLLLLLMVLMSLGSERNGNLRSGNLKGKM